VEEDIVEPTRILSSFCADTRFADLPASVTAKAKLAVLDTLGCAFATYSEEPDRAKIIHRVAGQLGTRGGATVIGIGTTASAPIAALANGVICHSIDFDDLHAEALTHTSCVILPAALASAEESGVSGKEFITSFVLGYEVAVRVGMTVMPSHYDHWHSTATNGTFGAAVAAGKNHRFKIDQYVNALGFSGTQAAGLLTYLQFGDYSKSLNPGKAAFNGVLSAMLAKAGAVAPPNIIENPKGYAAAYSAAPQLRKLTRGMDGGAMVWEILNNTPKPFPSLSASHTAMETTLRLVSGHDLKPEDIAKITVRTYGVVKSQFSNHRPDNVMAARLSVPYCVAVCAATRRSGLDAFRTKTIKNASVREMLEKVDIVVDPELDALYPKALPCKIEITMKNGQVHKDKTYDAKGSPGNPLSDAELYEKFKRLAEPAIGAKRANQIADMTKDLEGVKNIEAFGRLLRRKVRL
jgi:2-methylcitrate dehydratase PrpD